ncbi:metaxin-2-like [Diabrotica virgifera virgifera]|uniref:Metaxin-2-like n=1 Tax=Diabrotica virgifera virgifera TaxID=50390 RepID=A0ABM5J0D5_DIAVI|nr:metaxin-2-like [Diabrotica virgifera virgifera]
MQMLAKNEHNVEPELKSNLLKENLEVQRLDSDTNTNKLKRDDGKTEISTKEISTERISTSTSLIVHGPSNRSSSTSSELEWVDKITVINKMDKQMILYEYANSLAIQAFLKMCNLGYEIEERENAADMSPTRTIPFIKVEKCIVGELEHIIHFIKNKNINLSDKLSHGQKIDLNSYMALANNLKLVEIYVCWRDKKIYKEVTRLKNGSVYPWPLNWIHTLMRRNQANKYLKSFEWNDKSLSEVLYEFERTCDALNRRLDGKTRFFEIGDTELDACVFGHLYAVLYTPFPKNYLVNYVKGFPKLIKFVKRVKKEYF